MCLIIWLLDCWSACQSTRNDDTKRSGWCPKLLQTYASKVNQFCSFDRTLAQVLHYLKFSWLNWIWEFLYLPSGITLKETTSYCLGRIFIYLTFFFLVPPVTMKTTTTVMMAMKTKWSYSCKEFLVGFCLQAITLIFWNFADG